MTETLDKSSAYPSSYYAATAHTKPKRPALAADIDTDIAIVGGGFSGLSAALHLAEYGRQTVVLEGAQIGWGASGRNGGMMMDGYSKELNIIEKKYGHRRSAVFAKFFHDGGKIIRRLIATYGINCDLKGSTITTAFNRKHLRELAAAVNDSDSGCELVDKVKLRQYIGSDAYIGGLIEYYNGHLHPLNLALGEAAAFEKLGGTIYENTKVNALKPDSQRVTLTTDNGEVRCQQVLLCGNAYLGKLVPELTERIMPVSSQMIATEPLGDMATEILPSDAAVCDMRHILDYYRLSADKRLLFGGCTMYGNTTPSDIEAKIRPNMEKIFPQLTGIGVEYAWNGSIALSFSRVPQLGQVHERVSFAHGYSGHGVTVTHLFGRILADACQGRRQDLDTFAAMPWTSFPGGRLLRVPYTVAGAWWYSARDYLGI